MKSKKNHMSVVLAGLLALAVAAVLGPGSSGTGGGARLAQAAPILSLDAVAKQSDVVLASADPPPPTPPPLPPVTGSMLLALGDSVMAGCCTDWNAGVADLFNAYLSARHDEEVTLVNLALLSLGDLWTAESFINNAIHWPSGRTGTQLEEAVAVLGDAEASGATVRAITLDIGGNDFLGLVDPDSHAPCYETFSEACAVLFVEELVTYRGYLDTILSSLVRAKDPETPILFMNYYNPFDTGEVVQTIEDLIAQINLVIAEAAEAHGAYLVDIHPLFAGQAATLIMGVDPTPAGHQVLAGAFAAAYEAYLRSQIAVTPTATAPPSATAPATVEPPIVLPETGTGVGGGPAAFLPLASAAALAGTALVLALALRRRGM